MAENKGKMSSSAGKQDEGKEVDANRMLEMRRCEVGECCATVGFEIECRNVGVEGLPLELGGGRLVCNPN